MKNPPSPDAKVEVFRYVQRDKIDSSRTAQHLVGITLLTLQLL
ncbi:hypothetical protein [Methylotenera versatilis]|nr:hypothetical protein [Methylotenera versatilis]